LVSKRHTTEVSKLNILDPPEKDIALFLKEKVRPLVFVGNSTPTLDMTRYR